MKTRIESDSMGELKVPEDALYGAQTQRAINNFPVSGKSMPEAFVRALLVAKSAAAQANTSLGLLAPNVGNAITGVVQELLQSPELMSHFPVDVYQTGSGTSSNMNANEVLATLASSKTGESVSANDHINYGQSSNDIIPTCIHISAAVEVRERLLPALEHLHEVILVKAKKVDHHIKTGNPKALYGVLVVFAVPAPKDSAKDHRVQRFNATTKDTWKSRNCLHGRYRNA